MDLKIGGNWGELLKEEFMKPYFKQLSLFVNNEYDSQEVYPPRNAIFRAFDKCDIEDVKVVILGQDPYHGLGQANGLCFSVSTGVPNPPSLVNIFKEINNDIGISSLSNGNLESWANQGVLLLNSTLTVRANQAGSHQKEGWEDFTDAVIKKLSKHKGGLVYFLWGAYAQKKGSILDPTKNLILKSVHPSPLSAYKGFYGNKHFSKANNYLKNRGQRAIEW
jgi:uracil-DNA glycosylase